jgi:ribokinase
VKCSPEILALADTLTPNETEAETLTSIAVTDPDSAQRAARALLASKEQRVIVKMGGRGAMVCSVNDCRYMPPVSVPVVDTTAAGDAFCGGLATELARGKSFDDALRFAMYAGALAVTRLGAQSSLPYESAVLELMARQPYPS